MQFELSQEDYQALRRIQKKEREPSSSALSQGNGANHVASRTHYKEEILGHLPLLHWLPVQELHDYVNRQWDEEQVFPSPS